MPLIDKLPEFSELLLIPLLSSYDAAADLNLYDPVYCWVAGVKPPTLFDLAPVSRIMYYSWQRGVIRLIWGEQTLGKII